MENDLYFPRAQQRAAIFRVVPTKLVIKKNGKKNYRMWVTQGGKTLLSAEGSNADLALKLREKGYLPRVLGSKSCFTYIDEIDDSNSSGVLEIFKEYVVPKNLGQPIPFKAKIERSQYEPTSATLEQTVAKAVVSGGVPLAVQEMVYDVTLKYRVNAYPDEVTGSVESIASKLADEGVTVKSHSADEEKHKGYLRVGTQQNETALRDLIFDICRTSGFDPYEIPENISLIVVEPSSDAEQVAVIGIETGAQKQTTYMVNLEFITGTFPSEIKDATQRIANSLSNSGLTIGNINYTSELSSKFNVTGQIIHDALKKLLDGIRVGTTMYETPEVNVKVM